MSNSNYIRTSRDKIADIVDLLSLKYQQPSEMKDSHRALGDEGLTTAQVCLVVIAEIGDILEFAPNKIDMGDRYYIAAFLKQLVEIAWNG